MQRLFRGICPQSFKSLWTFLRFPGNRRRATPPGVAVSAPLRVGATLAVVPSPTMNGGGAAPARSSEGPGENYHVIARSEATWQSPGTAFVFAHSTRRLPRPDGLAMTAFFVQRYAGPPSHVIARSEATRRSPGTAFVFVHSPRRLPRACGPRNDSGSGKVVRIRRGAAVDSVHTAERRGRRSLRG